MKLLKMWITMFILTGFVNLHGCSFLNDFQREGTLTLAGLSKPVKVMRDEKGMAYQTMRSLT